MEQRYFYFKGSELSELSSTLRSDRLTVFVCLFVCLFTEVAVCIAERSTVCLPYIMIKDLCVMLTFFQVLVSLTSYNVQSVILYTVSHIASLQHKVTQFYVNAVGLPFLPIIFTLGSIQCLFLRFSQDWPIYNNHRLWKPNCVFFYIALGKNYSHHFIQNSWLLLLINVYLLCCVQLVFLVVRHFMRTSKWFIICVMTTNHLTCSTMIFGNWGQGNMVHSIHIAFSVLQLIAKEFQNKVKPLKWHTAVFLDYSIQLL